MKLLTSFLFMVLFVIEGYSDAYFDLDNKPDLLVTDYSDNEPNVCIKVSSLKKEKCFSISAENEDPDGLSFGINIYNGIKGEIIIDEHCCGIDKRFYIKFYKYSPKINSWLLYKIVNYSSILDEQYNYVNKYYDRKYFLNSQTDVLGKTYKNDLISEYTKDEIMRRLKFLLSTKIEKTTLTFFEVNELLFLYPLSTENLPEYNDLAYFIQKKGDHKLALFILEKVISKFPDRVVAYLNIADSQVEMEQESEAKKNYSKYLDLMKKNGKLKKVPKRVFKYLKEHGEATIKPEEQQINIDIAKTTIFNSAKIGKQELETTSPKDTKVIKAEKSEPTKTASGSPSFTLLASMFSLLVWRLS